jgi:hypothetical protein
LARAQIALTPPQAGFMRDATDSLRPVYGIAGNFLVGDSVAVGVVSAAYSGSCGLIKTVSAVVVIDRAGSRVASNDAPDGPALFAFARTGEPALAYLAAANTLLAWKAGAFEAVPFDSTMLGAGVVLAIAAPDAEHAAMTVQRDDGLWDVRIYLASGEIDSQTAIPRVAGPVLILGTGELVYSAFDGLVVRKPDGSERRIHGQLPASFALDQMGDGWIQVRDLAGGRQFAVRTTENRGQFYQLPEVEQ